MLTDTLTRATPLDRRPLTDAFGAEIIGADLAKPLDDATARAIRDIWIDAGILLLRGTDQDDEAQMRLSTIFGEMEPAATADLNDPTNRFMMTLAYDPADPLHPNAAHR